MERDGVGREIARTQDLGFSGQGGNTFDRAFVGHEHLGS